MALDYHTKDKLMNYMHIDAQLTVSELVTAWQETIPVFIRHRMACVGCPVSPFETLENVAVTYGLKLDTFLNELETAISEREQGAHQA